MDKVIVQANLLEKVMKAKETYNAAVEEYRAYALENGVSKETVNQILYDREINVRDVYE